MQANLQNHVAIVLDRSGSMASLLPKARQVLENLIQYLKEKSVGFDQETRVSVYVFDDKTECIIYNMDVMRFKKFDDFKSGGMTALMDATDHALNDLGKIPQLYFDHAFLTYVITDGMENASYKTRLTSFHSRINSLPDNHTLIAFAPSNMTRSHLETLGFNKGNIDLWDTTERGMEEVGERISKSMDNYFSMRSQGVRSSSSMITDLSKVSKEVIRKSMDKVAKNKYNVIQNNGTKAVQIRDLVENLLGTKYVTGNAFYQLVKTEHVQDHKKVAIEDVKTGEVFVGVEARKMLGLPSSGTAKIKPGDHGRWRVFIQSTAVNRNIIPNQMVFVLKSSRSLQLV